MPASSIRPAARPRRTASARSPGATSSRRPGGGRERHRHLELRIIAAAGALIGVGPAGIEHVFAARVGLQIARHDAGDRAVFGLRHEMLRLPAGARRGRAGGLQGGQESVRDEGVIGANLRRSDCGLAQASQCAAGMSAMVGTTRMRKSAHCVCKSTAESPRKSSGRPSAWRGSGLPRCAPSRSAAAGRTHGVQ